MLHGFGKRNVLLRLIGINADRAPRRGAAWPVGDAGAEVQAGAWAPMRVQAQAGKPEIRGELDGALCHGPRSHGGRQDIRRVDDAARLAVVMVGIRVGPSRAAQGAPVRRESNGLAPHVPEHVEQYQQALVHAGHPVAAITVELVALEVVQLHVCSAARFVGTVLILTGITPTASG